MESNRRSFLSAAGLSAAGLSAAGPLLAQGLPAGPPGAGPSTGAPSQSAQGQSAPAGQSGGPPAVSAEAGSGPVQAGELPTVTVPGYASPSQTRKIEFRNLRTIEEDARKVIPPGGFGYISSGAGDEWTMHENMAAFKRRQILPRYLSGNGPVDTATTLLGTKLALPIITTVFGGHAIAHVNAEAATAKGTHAAGTLFTCGSQSNLTMEQVASPPARAGCSSTCRPTAG